MDIPLLKTKLYSPPARPGLVSRPRLVERLEEGLRGGSKLSLISAPAGFGKTTLLTEWVRGGGRPVAWVSLDEGDNDPARFLAYTVAALRQAQDAALRQAQDAALRQAQDAALRQAQDAALRQAQDAALRQAQDAAGAGQARPETFDPAGLTALEPALVPLINEMADLRPGPILVLDDYHLIESREIHDGVAFLLDHLPPHLHLVIATRADPPLPLARLRARGRLTELRYEELRFTAQEVTAFLNEMMGLDLAPEEVQALEARTEGWIAGLQLAALSLRGRADVRGFIEAFSSSHHYVLEYLTAETLDRLPEPFQSFLLQTAVLDRLCGALCDAVTGESGGEAQLARMYRDNLFLAPLDDERLWYRYHPLFADLLLKRLMKGTGRERVDELRRRASAWHESQGSLDEAISYAVQARDYGRVVRLVEGAASAGLLESRLSSTLRWLEAVPEELLLLRPQLCIYQAWALVINEQLDRAVQMLRKSSEALASAPPSAEGGPLRDRLGELLTVVELMASLLAAAYSGKDLDQVCQTALEVRDRALETGNVFMAAHVVNGLAMGRFHQGRLTEASRYYHELVALGHEGPASQLPLAAVGHVGLASIGVERDEREAAEQHLDEAMRLGRHRIGTNTLVSAALARARLREYAGDRDGALAALDEVERIGRVRQSAPAAHRLIRQRLWLHLRAGELDQAERLARRLEEPFGADRSGEGKPAVFREAEQILLARLSLGRGEPAGTLELSAEAERMAQAGKRSGRLIEIHLLQALAHQAQGRNSEALTNLERALALAEPEGYERVFLDEGEPAAALLRVFGRRSPAPTHLNRFAQRLLEAFDATPPGAGEGVPAARPGLVEPLTRRERQVLRRLAAGLSAPEIAQELVVAPSTVRSHIKAIYGKLGVHSRHEAIGRARALELV